MTERETKAYLVSIRVLTEKRDKKLEQIAELRSVATNCVAPTDKEPIQSSGSGDKMANIVGKIADIGHEIDNLEIIINNRRFFVEHTLDRLSNDRHSQYIKTRYLDFLGFYETVMKMELTDSTARRIERRAISEITRLINESKHNI